ncbi:MAG: hypothetical protein HYV02_02235 [Deltaproteobacteria bacterium]|nr:hypothetical protein [Deltaproteobacteria bacterium]
MVFEYVHAFPCATPRDTSPEPFVKQVAEILDRCERSNGPIKTIHGELRVSCRPLSRSECEQLGLHATMRRDCRFAVHIEGGWHLHPHGEPTEVVIDLFGGGDGACDSATASLRSGETYVDLTDREMHLITGELLSALQLMASQ